jgi:hypothetical protein
MFKPGKYFIGDPCYAIADEHWDRFLEVKYGEDWLQNADQMDETNTHFEFDGHQVFVGATAFGDGVYFDNETDTEYGVDSGTLGLIPIELCTNKEDLVNLEKLGRVVDFSDSFECDVNNGEFTFGDIEINTRENDQDEDEDDCDEEDDEEYEETDWEDDEDEMFDRID